LPQPTLSEDCFYSYTVVHAPEGYPAMMQQRTDQERDALSDALALIDPSGTLVPGTEAHDAIRDMILDWMDRCGPDYAIGMAQIGAKHLDRWIKYL
jgi:hypothetical protein